MDSSAICTCEFSIVIVYAACVRWLLIRQKHLISFEASRALGDDISLHEDVYQKNSEEIPSRLVKRQRPSDYTESRLENKRYHTENWALDLNSNIIDLRTTNDSEAFADGTLEMDVDEPSENMVVSLDSPMWVDPEASWPNREMEFLGRDYTEHGIGTSTIPRWGDYALEYDSYVWNPGNPEEVIYQKLRSMTTATICYGAVSSRLFQNTLCSIGGNEN